MANRLHVVERNAPDHAADGHRPAHLDLVRLPEVREPVRHRPTRLRPIKGKPVEPLNVHQPDRRVEMDSLAYPFSTVGRVALPLARGSDQLKLGTGALVGPRHVLTASHVMNRHWPGPNLSPVSFTPSFNHRTGPATSPPCPRSRAPGRAQPGRAHSLARGRGEPPAGGPGGVARKFVNFFTRKSALWGDGADPEGRL
ncbi:hypothetical protein ACIRQP_29910 [Streptomyces sp. NPDC102274]|uniref:hypothetical protein n=1 Tax=Streptomyces sp. NPDC102274 TaxID=3366151 RepID=UPI0038082507